MHLIVYIKQSLYLLPMSGLRISNQLCTRLVSYAPKCVTRVYANKIRLIIIIIIMHSTTQTNKLTLSIFKL